MVPWDDLPGFLDAVRPALHLPVPADPSDR
jgi:hypothetical protein